jgi:hypothetical protein
MNSPCLEGAGFSLSTVKYSEQLTAPIKLRYNRFYT